MRRSAGRRAAQTGKSRRWRAPFARRHRQHAGVSPRLILAQHGRSSASAL